MSAKKKYVGKSCFFFLIENEDVQILIKIISGIELFPLVLTIEFCL